MDFRDTSMSVTLKNCDAVRIFFTEDEKRLIQELYLIHRDILNSKNKDSVTNGKKASAWEDIAQKFNAKEFVKNKRDVKSIKKCWENQLLAFKKARYKINPSAIEKAVCQGRIGEILGDVPFQENSDSTTQFKDVKVKEEHVTGRLTPVLPPKRPAFFRRKRIFRPSHVNTEDSEVIEMRRREHEMKEEEHAIKMENLILKREVLKRKLAYYSGSLGELQNGSAHSQASSEYVLP